MILPIEHFFSQNRPLRSKCAYHCVPRSDAPRPEAETECRRQKTNTEHTQGCMTNLPLLTACKTPHTPQVKAGCSIIKAGTEQKARNNLLPVWTG